jgi:hypothetical protein
MIKNRIENLPATRLGANQPGTRAAAKALVALLCCIAALVAVGCATRPFTVKPDDPLFSTWVSTAYESKGTSAGFEKIVLFPDGRRLQYRQISDAEPAYEGKYAVEAAWIDQKGYRWYKMKGAYWTYKAGAGRTEMFILARIDPKGTVLESSSAGNGYPDKVEPVTSPNYGIMYRQR